MTNDTEPFITADDQFNRKGSLKRPERLILIGLAITAIPLAVMLLTGCQKKEAIAAPAPAPTVTATPTPTPEAVVIPESNLRDFTIDGQTYELPPCPSEDSANCYWDAKVMGNGQGDSFVDIEGEVHYID